MELCHEAHNPWSDDDDTAGLDNDHPRSARVACQRSLSPYIFPVARVLSLGRNGVANPCARGQGLSLGMDALVHARVELVYSARARSLAQWAAPGGASRAGARGSSPLPFRPSTVRHVIGAVLS